MAELLALGSQVEAEEADDLREWRGRMEAQAAKHGWEAPTGFTPESWPPFVDRRK